ncbi:MAG: helical backbone metal receptor, partial [Planctomycetota bacterium]|nr:helical backbone metal receptor [Planctomycetota bacterium]
MAAAAARYVSLVPSLTETLFELGVGEAVVGATKFCVHPRPAVDAVPRVGGTKDPRVDRILALSPTLVLVNQEENRLEDVERLRAAGLEVHVTFP